MHDTGGHMSSSDTSSHSGGSYSHSSHTAHTSFPTWEQGPQYPTMNAGDQVGYYNGGIPRRRGGAGLVMAVMVMAAILPIVFTLLAFMH